MTLGGKLVMPGGELLCLRRLLLLRQRAALGEHVGGGRLLRLLRLCLRRLVLAAFTRPELLTRWYGARGWQLVSCEIDLRPGGGAYRFVSEGPGGARMVQSGVYRQVEPDEGFARLDHLLKAGPVKEGNSTMNWTLEVVVVPAGNMRTGGPAKTAAALARTAERMTAQERDLYGRAFDTFGAKLNSMQGSRLASAEAAARVIEVAEQNPAPRLAAVGRDTEEILRAVREQSDAEQDALRLEIVGLN